MRQPLGQGTSTIGPLMFALVCGLCSTGCIQRYDHFHQEEGGPSDALFDGNSDWFPSDVFDDGQLLDTRLDSVSQVDSEISDLDDEDVVPYCGDGVCSADENCFGCEPDCGCSDGLVCFQKACCKAKDCAALGKECGEWDDQCGGIAICAGCGLGHCEEGYCASVCPNGLCEPAESFESCPEDCDASPTPGFGKVSSGEFWIGSPDGTCPSGYPGASCGPEIGRISHETLHHVELTRTFEIQENEVTQGDWQSAFSGWNPSGFPECGALCPVEKVSWFDALAYANWRSEQAGLPVCYSFSDVTCADGAEVADYKECLTSAHGGVDQALVQVNAELGSPYRCAGFRLPMESEWEVAARAGANTPLYTSEGNDGSLTQNQCVPLDSNLDQIAWYCGNQTGQTKPVRGKEPNAWGLHDMGGNVWEWCWDWFNLYPSSEPGSPLIDPDGGEMTLAHRVIRGGGWKSEATTCRSAHRAFAVAGYRYNNQGFRLARTLSL